MEERSEGRGRLITVLVAVIGVALAAVFFSMWLGARGVKAEEVSSYLDDEIEAATEVATEVVTAITTYDATTIEDRRAELLELSTGSFRQDYEALLEGGLGEALEDSAVESEGEIVDGPDVGFDSSDRALAVARVVQDVISRENPGGRTVFLVVRLGLVKEDDGWKADSLKILSQQIL